jgi:hypothetical protein
VSFGCEHCSTNTPGDEWRADEPHRCPLANEEIRKLRIALTNLFYWTVQRHEIGGSATTARNLAVKEADVMIHWDAEKSGETQ